MNQSIEGHISRKEQAGKRRQAILESALGVFVQKGYMRTTVKDLAKAAGISSGLMYHYFESKEHLFEEAIKQRSFLPQLRKILEQNKNAPSRHILKTVGQEFLKFLKQQSGIMDLMMREGSSNEKLQAIWHQLALDGVTVLSNYLIARITRGELRPHSTTVTARCLFSSVLVLHFTKDILVSGKITEGQFIDELVDNLLDGIEVKGNN